MKGPISEDEKMKGLVGENEKRKNVKVLNMKEVTNSIAFFNSEHHF
jgi:hypothetical protein